MHKLHITAPGDDLSVYAVLRRHSDGAAWDAGGAAWAGWADGSLSDFAITLSGLGGDLYEAEGPSGIEAGLRLRVHYYQQLGPSPGSDDLLLAVDDTRWLGAEPEPTGQVAVSVRALTDLASLKRHLRLDAAETAEDDLLAELINAATDRIERLCGRRLMAGDYAQFLGVDADGRVRCPQYPLIRVDRLAVGRGPGLRVRHTGSEPLGTVQVDADALRLSTLASDGTKQVTTLSFAAYPTLSLLTAGIEATAGFTADLASDTDAESRLLYPTAARNATAADVALHRPDRDTEPADVEAQLGLIHLPSPSRELGLSRHRLGHTAFVGYRAGYETAPDALALACRRLAAEGYHLGRHDAAATRETLGDYTVWLVDQARLTESHLRLLAPYLELR